MLIKESLSAILVENGKPLAIDTLRLPDRLKTGQVLVKLITSGICGAQLNEIDAVKGPDRFLPHLLGHEGFAEVLEVSPDSKKVAVGDHVVLHWRPGTGIESETPRYLLGNQVVNAGWVTTFNQFAVVSENRITKIKSSINSHFAPLLGCALTTSIGVLENDAKVNYRDSLLISGFGGVGSALLQFARFLRVRSVIILEKDERKREEALRQGANYFISASNFDHCKRQLDDICLRIGRPSVALETTGNARMIELCYEKSADQARVILVGVPALNDKASIYTLPLHFGKVLKGSKGGDSKPDIDIPMIESLIESNDIKPENFVTHTFKFADINRAIQSLRNGIIGRIILEF